MVPKVLYLLSFAAFQLAAAAGAAHASLVGGGGGGLPACLPARTPAGPTDTAVRVPRQFQN